MDRQMACAKSATELMSEAHEKLLCVAPHITIEDRPFGTGKTTNLINGLRADCRYLIITPLLSEVERIVEGAPEGVLIEHPEADGKGQFSQLPSYSVVSASGWPPSSDRNHQMSAVSLT
ncbi:hypothetical protein [uncultured Roseobacter sp.]|uniref:hypothetical protein n=1 Tax=uncultured Roseobacter sp. TaxID=114847 RepID=UPI00262873C3|nr:hypothetical protein [uncultured Roseobacter sp.]